MDKKLSERKQRILKAVVDEYIKNATPVSSGEIKAKYFENISSATIRAELSTLEDMGYLFQPHTSAGRVPAPSAYKYYVENFINRKPLQKQDLAIIDASFNSKFNQFEDIVKTTAKVISDITNYTSVIVINNIDAVTIKEIKLVGLDEHTALVIIITDSGIIRDKVISVEHRVDEQFIFEAKTLINKIFAGLKVGELNKSSVLVEKELSEFRELFDSVLDILRSYCETDEKSVFMEGASKLMEYPETNLESARNFLSIIDNKQSMIDLIGDASDIEFSVKIGKDETGGMDKCAIVTAKYMVNGKEVGQAGVIGPERMDYAKVMSVLKYVGSTLDSIIEPKGDECDE